MRESERTTRERKRCRLRVARVAFVSSSASDIGQAFIVDGRDVYIALAKSSQSLENQACVRLGDGSSTGLGARGSIATLLAGRVVRVHSCGGNERIRPRRSKAGACQGASRLATALFSERASRRIHLDTQYAEAIARLQRPAPPRARQERLAISWLVPRMGAAPRALGRQRRSNFVVHRLPVTHDKGRQKT